jgi:hypothetical protein
VCVYAHVNVYIYSVNVCSSHCYMSPLTTVCVLVLLSLTYEQLANSSEFVRHYGDRDGDGYLSYEELEDIDPEML